MYIDLDNAVSKFKIYTKQFDTKDKNIDRNNSMKSCGK